MCKLGLLNSVFEICHQFVLILLYVIFFLVFFSLSLELTRLCQITVILPYSICLTFGSFQRSYVLITNIYSLRLGCCCCSYLVLCTSIRSVDVIFHSQAAWKKEEHYPLLVVSQGVPVHCMNNIFTFRAFIWSVPIW